MKKTSAVFIFLFLFSLAFVSAVPETWKYNYLESGEDVQFGGNYSINVNNTEYWRGYSPASFIQYMKGLDWEWTGVHSMYELIISGGAGTCPEGYIADPWGGCAVSVQDMLNVTEIPGPNWLVYPEESVGAWNSGHYAKFGGSGDCISSSNSCTVTEIGANPGVYPNGYIVVSDTGIVQGDGGDGCDAEQIVYIYDSAGCSSPSPSGATLGNITLNDDTISSWENVGDFLTYVSNDIDFKKKR